MLAVQVGELSVEGGFVVEERDGHVQTAVHTGNVGLEGRRVDVVSSDTLEEGTGLGRLGEDTGSRETGER